MLKSLSRFGHWLAFTSAGYAALFILSAVLSLAILASLAVLFCLN